MTVSTRAFTDLAAAIEKANAASFAALGDTAQDRARRDESADDDSTASEMHSRIAAAMASLGGPSSPTAQLADAQSTIVANL